MSEQHVHCWHGDIIQHVEPPIMALRCCWCGQEQRELVRDALEHGPFAHRAALQLARRATDGRRQDEGGAEA